MGTQGVSHSMAWAGGDLKAHLIPTLLWLESHPPRNLLSHLQWDPRQPTPCTALHRGRAEAKPHCMDEQENPTPPLHAPAGSASPWDRAWQPPLTPSRALPPVPPGFASWMP